MLISSLGKGHTSLPDSLGAFRDEVIAGGSGTVGKTTELYVLMDGDIPAGLCGVIWHSKTCKFKNAYVSASYRGCGYYKDMLEFRLDLAKKRGMKQVDAICTYMSIKEFQKRGAYLVRYHKGWNLTHVRILL